MHHGTACRMWWQLWYRIHNKASNGTASSNLSLRVWLNTITDPPFHTEKIKFLRKNNWKPSIPGPVKASQRVPCAIARRSRLCGDNAATGFWYRLWRLARRLLTRQRVMVEHTGLLVGLLPLVWEKVRTVTAWPGENRPLVDDVVDWWRVCPLTYTMWKCNIATHWFL